jgi:hypothetical protein
VTLGTQISRWASKEGRQLQTPSQTSVVFIVEFSLVGIEHRSLS